MIPAILCLCLFAPQVFAGWRGFSPAAHLTLLLLSLTVVSSALVSLTAGSADPLHAQDAPPLMSYATIGLALLAPLYWVIEPLLPRRTTAVAAILAQTLSLCFAAAIAGSLHKVAQPLTQWLALGLVAGLLALAVSALWYHHAKK